MIRPTSTETPKAIIDPSPEGVDDLEPRPMIGGEVVPDLEATWVIASDVMNDQKRISVIAFEDVHDLAANHGPWLEVVGGLGRISGLGRRSSAAFGESW